MNATPRRRPLKVIQWTTGNIGRRSLHAIIGRHSGEIPGFAYSTANKNSGIVWSEEELFKYLEAPQKVIPGTKMAFAGLKKPQDRADVIAYLKSATK